MADKKQEQITKCPSCNATEPKDCVCDPHNEAFLKQWAEQDKQEWTYGLKATGMFEVLNPDGFVFLTLISKEYAKLMVNKFNRLDYLEERTKVLKEALEKIANWKLPATGKFWDREKTQPTSYETEYGSNGARDYIKSIATNALNTAAK